MISNYAARVGGDLVGSRYQGGFSSPLKELNAQTALVESAEKNYNDSYRQHTKYDDGKDSYYSAYDLGILLQNKDSYLEGKLECKSDVDYYSFCCGQRAFYEKMGVSSDITISLETASKECGYQLTVYDAEGNQIGMAADTGDGKKQLTIPNRNGQPNQYTIRVESINAEAAAEGAYRIRISEEKGSVKTAADDLTYAEHLEKLHREQEENLAEEQKYDGGLSKDELLAKLADGEALTEQERIHLKIFAGLSEYERAESRGYIKTELLPQLTEDLQNAGVDTADRAGGLWK